MTTAGISRSDQATQFAYLRYCQEYYTAWIKFMPEIEEAVRKFDGKKVTKRIQTAIEEINPGLSFYIDKPISWQVYIFFEWSDFDGRQFRDEATGQWDYVAGTSNRTHALMFYVDDIESFDAEKFIEALRNHAECQTEEKNKTFAALENFDTIKHEYNEAVEALNKAEDNIPSAIQKYYGVKVDYHPEWR